MTRQRILIVEDDPKLAEAIDRELGRTYDTRIAATGSEALLLAQASPFALVLLDLNLPDIDGIVVAESLKDQEVEILMLTARADVQSRIAGLYAGASDYLAKPFDMNELVARVYARLRKRRQETTYRNGELELMPDEGICTVAGRPIELTAQEFRLLSLLMSDKGRILSKTAIEDRLYRTDGPESNIVEVLVSRLRRKLTDAGVGELIHTIRGLGYVVR